MIEYPIVDERRCTGCGDCVPACPVTCLEMGSHIPWLPRPIDCVSCTLCALICPVDAIHMMSVEV